MQPRLFVAQAQDVAHQFAVVVLAGVFTTAGPGAPGFFAQVAACGESQEGHDHRTRQRHDVADQAAVQRRLLRVGAQEVGQAGEVGLTLQGQVPMRFVVQHVLRKARGQRGQRTHHLRVARLRSRRQLCPGTHEVGVNALQQALLFGAQAQAVAPRLQGGHAGEQRRVVVDRAVVRRHGLGHGALHGLQRRAG